MRRLVGGVRLCDRAETARRVRHRRRRQGGKEGVRALRGGALRVRRRLARWGWGHGSWDLGSAHWYDEPTKHAVSGPVDTAIHP
jgi:hypothetical protein